MSSKKIAKFINETKFLLHQGHPERARLLVQKVLKIDPNHEDGLIHLGLCEYSARNFSSATRIFLSLHQANPEHFEINKWAGICYLSLNQNDLAFQFLVRALKSHPKDLFILHSITRCLMASHRETDAIYYATEAVAYHPTQPDAHNILGGCLMEINRFQDALTCFETAILLDPHHFAANSNRANVLNRMQEFHKSVDAYLDCLKMAKTQEEVHEIKFKMSMPMLAIGRLEEGWEHFESGLIYNDTSSRNPKRVFDVPQWQGQSLKGKSILL